MLVVFIFIHCPFVKINDDNDNDYDDDDLFQTVSAVHEKMARGPNTVTIT